MITAAPPLLVTRTVALAAPAGPVAGRLAGVAGIAEVEAQGRRLRVRYDLRRLRFDDVLALLAAAGGPAAGGLMHRLRLGWVRFNEANRLDQADIVHQCCGKPPTD